MLFVFFFMMRNKKNVIQRMRMMLNMTHKNANLAFLKLYTPDASWKYCGFDNTPATNATIVPKKNIICTHPNHVISEKNVKKFDSDLPAAAAVAAVADMGKLRRVNKYTNPITNITMVNMMEGPRNRETTLPRSVKYIKNRNHKNKKYTKLKRIFSICRFGLYESWYDGWDAL